jgi:hypothetical protein
MMNHAAPVSGTHPTQSSDSRCAVASSDFSTNSSGWQRATTKPSASFIAFVQLASIKMRLKFVNRT